MDCMKKSDSYYRRKELMEKLEVPMMSEITEVLSEPLANVLFEQCPETLKPDLGVSPKLKGCDGELWISPSDLLIGKVVLKPPVTRRYLRALTHEGIIEIGAKIEQKFANEMRIEKESALKAQEDYLTFLSERKLNNAVDKVTQEITALFEDKIREMMNEFEERLDEELALLERKLRMDFEITLMAKENELAEYWKSKLVNCIRDTVTVLSQRYLQKLKEKEDKLLTEFNLKLQQEKTRLLVSLKIEEKHCRSRLNQLKHNLECKSIANMMYILCMERRKYQAEIKAVEDRYRIEVEELEKANKLRQEEIDKLVERLNDVRIKLSLREEFLLEIIRQFQKFINFALRATPTQAEFLLSVEKMMLYELTATIERFNRKKVQEECHDYLLPWKSDSQISLVNTADSLRAPDHHNCKSQLSEPLSNTSKNLLPSFYYNNKLYVREDFRNMISQDIQLSKTNLLWNKDVENLMVILKASVEKMKIDNSHSTCASFNDKEKLFTSPSQYSGRDQKSFVRNSIQKLSMKGGSLLSLAHSLQILDTTRKEQILTSTERLNLLGASDSLTKYKTSLENKQKGLPCQGCEEDSSASFTKKREQVRRVLSFSDDESDKLQVQDYGAIYGECNCSEEESKEWKDALVQTDDKSTEIFTPPRQVSNKSFESTLKLRKPLEAQTKKQSKISLHVDSYELLKKIKHLQHSKQVLMDDSMETPQLKKPSSADVFEGKRPDRYTIKDSPWKSYIRPYVESQESVTSVKAKLPKVTGIIGDKTGEEHLQRDKDFTINRMESIMKILNKRPSLLRMFTGCTLNH